MAVDRRFLNVKLSVKGIANEPSGTPVAYDQYIVGSEPAGAFAAATAGDIAKYDGSEWKFIHPVSNKIEVLNVADKIILGYANGAWEVVAEFGDKNGIGIEIVASIIPTASEVPATAEQGYQFLNTTDEKIYTATAADTFDAGVDMVVGDKYVSSTDFKVYAKGEDAKDLPAATILFVTDRGSFFGYDAVNSTFIDFKAPTIPVVAKTKVDVHTLTADDLTAKGFDLASEVADGMEGNTLLFVGSVLQIKDVDYSVTTSNGVSSISYDGLALDSQSLQVGDVFVVQYQYI